MIAKLRITFVLPRTGEWPSGGLRIVYQYANYLSRRGHLVTVVHPGRLIIDPTWLDTLKNFARYCLRKIDGNYKPTAWIKVESSVRLVCVPSLEERFIPDGDVVIATAWQTAEWVARYPISKGRRFYFIQHLETWNGPEERVYATWKMPLKKIVPSKWLAQIAEDMEESVSYIPSGLDMDVFETIVPPESRSSNQVMMLYHNAEWKGCEDGFAAIELVKKQIPDLQVILFGVPERPETLPDWMEYHQKPAPNALRDLYNRAAIFVAPSRTEGFGLTGCEALLCGAALVATDIDGHREFAFDGRTALTSPARCPEALAQNILRLIRDSALRMELVREGHRFVRQLTWDRAVDEYERTLYADNEIKSGRESDE